MQRLSKVTLRNGAKRPEVHLLQEALNAVYTNRTLAVDGWFGGHTESAVKAFQADMHILIDGIVGRDTWTCLLKRAYTAGWKPQLERKIQSLICLFETGHRTNAYGFAEPDIGDGAGANYGVLCHNARGSVKTLCGLAGRSDIYKLYAAHPQKEVCSALRGWIGTPAGIAAQDKYFRKYIVGRAIDELGKLPVVNEWLQHEGTKVYWQRALLLACDSVVQNGTLFSNTRKPFWKSLSESEARVAYKRELYYGIEFDEMFRRARITYSSLKTNWLACEADSESRRQTNVTSMVAFLNFVVDPELCLKLMAQWRARTSASRWWRGVEARRMLDATGKGRVHGEWIDLEQDYGIGA